MYSLRQSSLLSSVFDDDDVSQSLELYKLLGYSKDIACKITALQLEKTERQVYQRELAEYKTSLSCILRPETDKLQSLPVYDRYVVWCINYYGVRKAAEHLGFSRMSFYRWLDKNGYSHKFKR